MKSLVFFLCVNVFSTQLILGCASSPNPDDPLILKKKITAIQEKLLQQKQEEDREIKQMKDTYDQLIISLKDEVDKKKIEVSQYKGALTINIMDEIFFDSAQADIRKESYDILNRVGNIIKKLPDKIIQIEGHTDDIPLKAHKNIFPNNWVLGARRAVNVAVYFETVLKIDPSRLTVLSFSKYRPLVPNTSKENRAKNRRIEIVLVDRSLYQHMEMKRSLE